ncbi:MAG: hypothetical protein EX260_08620, partial [Desulfobulbaceae bacterium]
MTKEVDNRTFLTWLTVALILASMWIFKAYLHYILVAAVLALSTSHLFSGFTRLLENNRKQGFIHNNREFLGALFMTIVFLVMLFVPLLYFISMTYDRAATLDIAQLKTTLTAMIDRAVALLNN